MMWETGKAHVLKQEATHCTYDNQTCYQARSVPVIFDTSSSIGYHTGGMNLTVRGYGFNTGKIVAKVDGQDCVVTSSYESSFNCRVAAKPQLPPAVSSNDANSTSTANATSEPIIGYLGSYGLRRVLYNQSYIDWKYLERYTPYSKSLALNLESPTNEGD